MKLQLSTLSDSDFDAFRLAADLAFRGIQRHPYTQTSHPGATITAANPGLCERAPQTQREADAQR